MWVKVKVRLLQVWVKVSEIVIYSNAKSLEMRLGSKNSMVQSTLFHVLTIATRWPYCHHQRDLTELTGRNRSIDAMVMRMCVVCCLCVWCCVCACGVLCVRVVWCGVCACGVLFVRTRGVVCVMCCVCVRCVCACVCACVRCVCVCLTARNRSMVTMVMRIALKFEVVWNM